MHKLSEPHLLLINDSHLLFSTPAVLLLHDPPKALAIKHVFDIAVETIVPPDSKPSTTRKEEVRALAQASLELSLIHI